MLFRVSEQKNTQLWCHHRLTQAVSYFAKTLRIPNPKELDIRLLLSANKKLIRDSEHGNVRTLRESYINGLPHQFKVTVQKDMPWTWTLSTFAHEMVHVWQYATGVLRYRWFDGEWQDQWDGGSWTKEGSITYRDRPWEVHARSKEAALIQGFFAIEQKDGPCGVHYGIHR